MRTSSLLVAALACPCAAAAADYPSKPVRIIVAVAPGGGVDIQARLSAQKVSESIGRPFVVENRPSAGGADAYNLVAKSPPDGYTLLAVNASFTVPQPASRTLPDTQKDFAPIALLTRSPSLLVVHPSMPVKTPREFIAFARARPGKINYGGAPLGTATHLAAVWFFTVAKIDVVYVPYKGAGPALSAMLGGETAVTMASVLSVGAYVTSGKLRALGVTTLQRSKVYPNLPTVAEQGAPGFDYAPFFGWVAPARTPAPVVSLLNAELIKAMSSPDVVEKLREDGAEPQRTTPDEFAQFIAVESRRWRKVVQDSGIRLE